MKFIGQAPAIKPASPASAARAELVRCYRKATYCYAALVGLLILSFWVPFLGALWLFAPLLLGLAGLLFAKRGLALTVKSGDQEKRDVGYANLVLGFLLLVLGLLGLAFAYVALA